MVSPALSWASLVLAPRCGVTTMLSSPKERGLGHRLGGEHVERSAGDDTITNAISEILLVHDAAAGDVDHSQRRLGLEQQIAVDQTQGLGGLGKVHRQEVRLGDQLVERQQFDPHLLRAVLRHEGVVRHDAHPERPSAVGHELADTAKANDTEGLVDQLDAGPATALPAARNERCMGLGHVACLGEQEGHRVLGCGDDVALGCIDHHDALLGGCTDIDVVEADASSSDDHEVVRNGEKFCGDLRCGANDERRCARDDRQQFLGGLADLDVDVVAGSVGGVQALRRRFLR